MKRHSMITLAFLLAALLCPSLSHAESRAFLATAGNVSTMVIAEQSGYARTYAMLTNGIARLHFDTATQTLDNLKFALLMNSFVTSSPQFLQEWNERRPLSGKEDEIGFMQDGPVKFEGGKGTVKGQLIIHGVRKDITFQAALNKVGRVSKANDIYDDGAETLGLSLHAPFKRSDYMLGGGEQSAFNDEVVLMLDIVAK